MSLLKCLDDMTHLEHPMPLLNCTSTVWCITGRHTIVAERSKGKSKTSEAISLSTLISSDPKAGINLSHYIQHRPLSLISSSPPPTRLLPGFWSQERDRCRTSQGQDRRFWCMWGLRWMGLPCHLVTSYRSKLLGAVFRDVLQRSAIGSSMPCKTLFPTRVTLHRYSKASRRI